MFQNTDSMEICYYSCQGQLMVGGILNLLMDSVVLVKIPYRTIAARFTGLTFYSAGIYNTHRSTTARPAVCLDEASIFDLQPRQS